MAEQCKGRVPDGTWGDDRRCSRKAKEDGYCTQHHPDTIKARADASRAKWDAKWAAKNKKREQAKRIADADAGLFDAVEEYFRKGMQIPERGNHHPDEMLDPVFQAYIERLEAIDA